MDGRRRGDLTVALDVTVTEELRNEGVARELVNRIQNIRKSSDFDITDKVKVLITSSPLTDASIAAFGQYIASQILADSIDVVDALDSEASQSLDIDGTEVKVEVTRVK